MRRQILTHHFISTYQVILVAHSTGGLVARAMPLLANYARGSVSAIVTIATSHSGSHAMLHSSLGGLYSQARRVLVFPAPVHGAMS